MFRGGGSTYAGQVPSHVALVAQGPRYLQIAIHVLVAALVIATTVIALAQGEPEWDTLGAVILLAAVYASGFLPIARATPQTTYVWGAVLSGAWVLLVVATPTGVWLAFPLFFLALHVLPRAAALLAIIALTGVAVCGFALHRGEWVVGGIVGPVLGAVVAVLTVIGLQTASAESQSRGVTAERDRLAREIHDTLAQGLNSIHLLLGAADAHLTSRPQEARRLIAQARTMASDNLEEARRFVRALSPADLAERSLVDALERIVEQVRSPTTTLEVTGKAHALPGGFDVALLRVAQEAIGNAVRHADATRIAVTLTFMHDEVVLDVVDDGNGQATELGGFGMSSMRQRVETLGGTFVVESHSGSGTAIAVSLPLDTA